MDPVSPPPHFRIIVFTLYPKYLLSKIKDNFRSLNRTLIVQHSTFNMKMYVLLHIPSVIKVMLIEERKKVQLDFVAKSISVKSLCWVNYYIVKIGG